MDPDELLAKARQAAALLRERGGERSLEAQDTLLSSFEALDAWLSCSNRLPEDWDKRCGAESMDGFICRNKLGHRGSHRYWTEDGSTMVSWR